MSTAADTAAPPSELEELLAPYRKETNTRAAAIVEDDRAIRVLVAWSAFPVPAWSPPAKAPRPTDPRELWLWLWLGLPLKKIYPELGKAGGVDPEVVESAFDVLVRLRLVFPDGTISDSCEQLLMSRLDAHTRTRGRPKARR